ncbi:MAG: flippase-like domain-containing protein [Gammaproteobacteria bacterium]|nr:flippase-like domain-containing protein [Gammaproteobacteria bacterium]MCP5135951.1 flippase-like domain-containing protein [Gammaproteobacteria bacterium]
MFSEKQRHALIASIAIAALAYLGISLWSGWRDVLDAFIRVGIDGFALALALSFVNYTLRFGRWQMYLQRLGHPMPPRPSAMIYLSGFALTTTPGKAGEMLRGVFLRHRGMPYMESTAAFLSERLSDLVAIVLLCLFGASVLPSGGWVIAVGVFAVIGPLFVLSRWHWLRAIEQRFDQPQSRLARAGHHLARLLLVARRCHTPMLLLTTTVLSVIAWSAEAWAFHLVLHWLGFDPPIAFAFAVYALAMLAGALSFLPGGLGGSEVVMIGLLLWAGMGEAEATAATVVTRLATLWFAVILGVLALIFGQRELSPTAITEPSA